MAPGMCQDQRTRSLYILGVVCEGVYARFAMQLKNVIDEEELDAMVESEAEADTEMREGRPFSHVMWGNGDKQTMRRIYGKKNITETYSYR